VILIAHRGNIAGRIPERENSPGFLNEAVAAGYDVEVDVWWHSSTFWLGHDKPETPTSLSFLQNPRFWLHAKNIPALYELRQANLHCFIHDTDEATLTSRGFIWTYPGKLLTPQSICVFPERGLGTFDLCAGVCSDIVSTYR
jgi:hypothetical protein